MKRLEASVPTPDLHLPDRSEDVRSLMVRISKFLRELSLASETTASGHQQDLNLIRRRSLQTVAELGDLRDGLVSLAREKLSHKQMSMVTSRPCIEESLLVDPSIRFFGAEWKGVSDRWINTVSIIHTVLETIDSKSIDIIQLNVVFSSLSRLESEISLHTEAVLSGRLTEEQRRLQYLQQQQFLSVPRQKSKSRSRKSSRDSQASSSSSRRCSPSPSPTTPVLRSRSMKERHNKERRTGYKKSKTADLNHKIEACNMPQILTTRSGSQNLEAMSDDTKHNGEVRRKSSFIEHISNLLKNIL